MIPFNKPLLCGNEHKYLQQCIAEGSFSGGGSFTGKCTGRLLEMSGAKKVIMTTSCTHAMEMAALLAGIKTGDEVIMPSFTFVSTANPFVLRGAKIVFVDVRPDTMNIDETIIEKAITSKTKAIVPVHYAGVGCEMDSIMAIAEKHNLLVIEDAAQCIAASYKKRPLGSIGHLGCLSFHETKNLQCGEGGALLINDERLLQRAEIISEKGTDRAKFLRGEVDKYSWVDVGSSYLPSELNAAFLLAQLEKTDEITDRRIRLWNLYDELLHPLAKSSKIEVSVVPEHCCHNGHIFYIKLKNIEERQSMTGRLGQAGIQSVFHFVPLHSAKAGKSYGRFYGNDNCTTLESERLLRLPLYYDLKEDEVDYVCNKIKDFWS